jgi:hypothetical protein
MCQSSLRPLALDPLIEGQMVSAKPESKLTLTPIGNIGVIYWFVTKLSPVGSTKNTVFAMYDLPMSRDNE